MKNKSKFTSELKAMIEKDILTCEETILTPDKTHDMFFDMKAKYLQLYPHICDGITISAKVPGVSTWEKELNRFKNALEAILVTQQEPQPVGKSQVSIGTIKLKNSGNIGNDNQLSKSTEVGVDLSIPIQPKYKK